MIELYSSTVLWLSMRNSNNFIHNIGKHYVRRSLVHALACSAFQ